MSLFVYGTLLSERVFLRTMGRQPGAKQAHLQGFHRFRVHGEQYPAIYARHRDDVVQGLVYLDVTKEEFSFLDEYEGAEYTKEYLEVNLSDGGVCAAFVYVYSASLVGSLHGTWSYETDFLPVEDEYVKQMDMKEEESK